MRKRILVVEDQEDNLQIMRDLFPGANSFAFFVNPRSPITERNVRDALEAARALQ